MPELPEVETTCQGLAKYVAGGVIQEAIVRNARLRWPIDPNLSALLRQQTILSLSRRGKYILMHLMQGTLILHLGMSGRWRVLREFQPPQTHDHVDIVLNATCIMRYTDPRRFGAILLTSESPYAHPLLKKLGVEPLSDAFDADYLLNKARGRRVPIKPFIMNSEIVVGVGNIYATEALFAAGIHPANPAGLIHKAQAVLLVAAIQDLLRRAIALGGTTLNDFLSSEGKPGYFAQHLQVYGRAKAPCFICHTPIQSCTLGQRGTTFCPNCQPSA